MTLQLKSFLDTIAWAEGTVQVPNSDNGYKVIVGSTPNRPILFYDYSDHPYRSMIIKFHRKIIHSDAAGRYQIMGWIFRHYKKQLRLNDFSPASQDAIAIQLIRECRALTDIEYGLINDALYKCRSRWASLPGAGYGQHEQLMDKLLEVFTRVGGIINNVI
jgi:muramidase (phage lysozyme)